MNREEHQRVGHFFAEPYFKFLSERKFTDYSHLVTDHKRSVFLGHLEEHGDLYFVGSPNYNYNYPFIFCRHGEVLFDYWQMPVTLRDHLARKNAHPWYDFAMRQAVKLKLCSGDFR